MHTYPHDPTAFTQGLEYRGGFLYEGTGLNGRSTLRKVELESGKVLQEISLDSQYFGEGITVLDRRVIELTWQSHRGFIYDRNTFQLIGNFDYPGEGWGLTNDGSHIFMSDGTAEIRSWNPSTLPETLRLVVIRRAHPCAVVKRTRIRSRRDLRQRLADEQGRPNLACGRPGHRVD